MGLHRARSPRTGGCIFAEDATLPFPQARVIWAAAVDPGVLSVTATTCAHASFDLKRQRSVVAVGDTGIEHVAIDLPSGLLRLDVIGGTVLCGPVDLCVHVAIGKRAPRQLAALDRLLQLAGRRDPGRRRPPPRDRRLPRLVEALRVADALSQGTSLSGIAAGLAVDGRLADDWPGDGDHLKSAVRRKVALARRLVALGPAGVLGFRT